MSRYLLADSQPELERLRLQAAVWEPAGRELLRTLPVTPRTRALDVGCGAAGLLRPLSEWAGAVGEVIGSDASPLMLDEAAAWVEAERLQNVRLVRDDVFATGLEPQSFDLVHARFMLAPLGRATEQLDCYRQLLRRGGTLVLAEPDSSSWRYEPRAPAVEELVALVRRAFAAGGGDLDAGRRLREHASRLGLSPLELRADVVSLPPGHPYLRLPLQFATSLASRLAAIAGSRTLARIVARAERELASPFRSGTSLTLVQCYGRV